jgi:carboxynorspermidine decarboxylase
LKDRIKDLGCDTPAFIIDQRALFESAMDLVRTAASCNCRLLFAMKSFSIADTLSSLAPRLDGFAASSLFEARLARQILGNHASVHITTPGFRANEIDQITDLCDFVSVNSLSQWHRFKARLLGKTSCGIRINPQVSFIDDYRYDPCRKHSKLGVPLDSLVAVMENEPGMLRDVEGLHFHSNCDSSDFGQLLETVRHLDTKLGELLRQVRWMNIGGGYLFEEAQNLDPFYEALTLLKGKYDIEVFVEPGAAIIRDAGYIVSSVLDIFESDAKKIAILDTTVSHMPEVFEYQFEPDVIGHRDEGEHEYILAGCTCLSGDVFGEYRFDEPLEIGSRVIFSNVGAYTLVKAHMFNGVNLPTIYSLTESGELVMKKRFSYEDFASRCGVETRVTATAKS